MTILEQIKAKSDKTGNHCGCYLAEFDGDRKEVMKELHRLHREKLIEVRDGIHGMLFKYKL